MYCIVPRIVPGVVSFAPAGAGDGVADDGACCFSFASPKSNSFAPLVVSNADNTALRIAVSVSATLVLAAMIWYSKSRRVSLVAGEGPVPEAERVSEMA